MITLSIKKNNQRIQKNPKNPKIHKNPKNPEIQKNPKNPKIQKNPENSTNQKKTTQVGATQVRASRAIKILSNNKLGSYHFLTDIV